MQKSHSIVGPPYLGVRGRVQLWNPVLITDTSDDHVLAKKMTFISRNYVHLWNLLKFMKIVYVCAKQSIHCLTLCTLTNIHHQDIQNSLRHALMVL